MQIVERWLFMSYINNDIAITQNGSAIVKSNAGKKVGTAVGVVGTAAALAMPADAFIKGGKEAIGGRNLIQALKNFIKGNNTSKLFGELTNKLSKAGRIGVVTGAVLAVAAIPVAINRGIGNLFDKSMNNHRAKRADVQVLADKLNK